MEHYSIERRAVIFFPKKAEPVFVKETAEVFEFFRYQFDIPHCPLRFLSLTLVLYKRVSGTHLMIV